MTDLIENITLTLAAYENPTCPLDGRVYYLDACIEFGESDEDGHEITITGEVEYPSMNDEGPEKNYDDLPRIIVKITDEEWKGAYGDCVAEKLNSLLDWSGTEHDDGTTCVCFN